MPGVLCADLAALGPSGAGIGGTLAVIGFFVRAMWLGHVRIPASLWESLKLSLPRSFEKVNGVTTR
jgi:hypothetical protein